MNNSDDTILINGVVFHPGEGMETNAIGIPLMPALTVRVTPLGASAPHRRSSRVKVSYDLDVVRTRLGKE